VALAVALAHRRADPQREQKYIEEQRRARRAAEAPGWRRDPEGLPARFAVELPADWLAQFHAGRVALRPVLAVRDRPAPPVPPESGPAIRLPRAEDNLLHVLEDIGEGRLADPLPVGPADFLNILEVCRETDLAVAGGGRLAVHGQAMHSRVRLAIDPASGVLRLALETVLPFLPDGASVAYCVAGRQGWAFGDGHLWPLERVLPLPYQPLYREPVTVPRAEVPRFLRQELPTLRQALPVEGEIGDDLVSIDPATPQFRLVLRGSPASLAAELRAAYGPHEVIAAAPAPEFALPDPDDAFHYLTRHPQTEERALERLAEAGFTGKRGDALTPVTGPRAVLNVLGGHVPALRRLGWRVNVEGRAAGLFEQSGFITPVVRVTEPEDEGGWFDVGFDFEDPDGSSVAAADIQRALLRGESFLECGPRTLLIDRDAVDAARAVFADCASRESTQPGHFRLARVHAPYVRGALAALDGIDMEEPPDWRQRAARQNREARIAPVPLDPRIEALLRPYQKEGVYWLRFLESSGLAGVLADEMGLGKTVQTLVWLSLPRLDPEARGKPALIVCPTSLVENWAREAQQFTPDLRCLVVAGTKRHENWDAIDEHDLVITSYALLRRDLDRYLDRAFAAAVLDEAQHIKNPATQNALSAKRIRARCRLVLTGTPVENGLTDLWSIMDFLLPGYLGDHDAFRLGYEQPIVRGDREGEAAQGRLRRRMHPFLLRRLKRDVARDLPEKIVKVSYCTLAPEQQRVYQRLLQAARQRLGTLVAERGFGRCRIEILAVLMRLRQACCHLGLLPENEAPGGAAAPSAKLDQFLELLDEALDGGHRLLVFSQFVSMLEILRRELDGRGIPYCYLDGQTRERLAEVQRFNGQRDVPAFLISLKAGGTGLNLTGADMVVHFDPWWNPAVEDQATDRAHRIGQKRTVYSIKLIAEHTVEEKVLALQRRKQAIIQATIGTTDESLMQSLTWDDVKDLLAS
jgi:superfamily II DNA or RNA helicase